MAKEKDRVTLRPVDESAEKDSRLVRLHKDTVEELPAVEDHAPVRVGEKILPKARLVADRREELSTSTDLGGEPYIGRNDDHTESIWDTKVTSGRIPWGWIALVGCVFAVGILWSLVSVNRSKEKRQELFTETENILQQEAREELEAGRLIEAIEGAVKNFYESQSVDELVSFVRHPERVRPLMEKYYAERPLEPTRVMGTQSIDPITVQNHATFWLVRNQLEGRPDGSLMVDATVSDSPKIDWETSVCYQPMDWDEFVNTRPQGYVGDFRVYVRSDNFYAYEFSDSDIFACFRLSSLDGEEILYGYANRDLPLMKNLEKILAETTGESIPMILTLTVPVGGLSSNGVIIERLRSPRWIYLQSPDTSQ